MVCARHSRYIGAMFEVLVFVYENYWRGDDCPEPAHLERKLNAVGFEADEIQEALTWLNDLNLAARGLQPPPLKEDACRLAPPLTAQPLLQSAHSMRVYSTAEQEHLGAAGLGFVMFLENAGGLSAQMREIVLDRAMAAPGGPVPLDDLKIMVLMVYWSLGQEPDALILDELCDDSTHRVAH